jgi:iron complex transport system substrate-binding protein
MSVRVCSLLPSGTEILFALGLGEQIIGVTDLCDYPPAAAAKRVVCRSRIDPSRLSSAEVEAEMHRILSAGESPYELDVEWLEQAAPEVVLTQDLCYFCEIDADTVNSAVRPLAIPPQVLNLNPRTVSEILESVIEVGTVCGSADRARALQASMQSRIDAVAEAINDVPRRPAVFSLEGVNPLVIGGHWVTDLLLRAGGRLPERFAPGCPAERISWDDVLEAQPEKLFVDLCSSDLARSVREIPWLAAQQGWNSLPAVRNGEVYLIDHSTLSRPGPRIVDGLEALAQLTHPDRITGKIPADTVLKLDADIACDLPPERIGDAFRAWPDGQSQFADCPDNGLTASGISDTSRV